jgi:hypothetical protein
VTETMTEPELDIENVNQALINALIYRIISGNLADVKTIVETEIPPNIRSQFTLVCKYAARNLDCLKYLHEQGFPIPFNTNTFDGACLSASEYGKVDCLQYLHEIGCPWNEMVCEYADNLECLRYLHENGCPWDEGTILMAILSGRLDCLQYAHENGCPVSSDWDTTIVTNVNSSMMQCVKYAHDHGMYPNLRIKIRPEPKLKSPKL